MAGRVKRKLERQRFAERDAQLRPETDAVCALCGRPLGERVEWHHAIPRSEGGTETVPLHPICHRAIHAHVSNRELAREHGSLDALREREDMRRFLAWVANKPANFHAPTRFRRD